MKGKPLSSASETPPPSAPLEPLRGRARRFATSRTVMALILREMSTRYGRTPGGYLWAVLEPLGGILILSLGFSLLIRSPSLGNSFLLFYASGFLPFQTYQTLSLVISRALSFSKPLLNYPTVTWVDAILARLILNLLTSLMVTYVLLAGILTFTDSNVVLQMRYLVEALALAALVGTGIGALNCLIMGLFKVYEQIWSIATRPLFIASGVIFIYEDLPTAVQNILWFNPLMHVTGIMRKGLYPMYNPEYISTIYVVGSSLACLTLGMILLGRYHKDILNP